MTKTILIEGEAYYNHAEAMCLSCSTNGKVLKEIGGSDYNRDALTQAELSTVLQVAKNHERTNPSHAVRVYDFRRGV